MIFKKIPLDPMNSSIYMDAYISDKISNLTRKAILVIPGGGYGDICSEREGEPIAQAFIPYGYNAFVLHYSVVENAPNAVFPKQLIEASLAISHIRDNAEEYGIDPEKVFVCGFSAGGHLCASIGLLWHRKDVTEAVGKPFGYNKPTGIMPVYPVISSTHHGFTFTNLLRNENPSLEDLEACSLENHVDENSCPAFIVHTSNDQTVNVCNSLALASAYAKIGMEFELHVYKDAPHGVALGNIITKCGNEKYENASIAKWVEAATMWADSI